jgi:hypothetical protein
MAKKQRKTKSVDKGQKKVLRELNEIKSATIEAGYFEQERSSDSKLSLADIAIWNEFGTFEAAGGRGGAQIGHIPPRPFLRPAYDENIVKYQATAKRLMQQLAGRSIGGLRILRTIGAMMVSDIKKKITDIKAPPNTPATIAAKGFNNPLIETGTLRNRADFRIKL